MAATSNSKIWELRKNGVKNHTGYMKISTREMSEENHCWGNVRSRCILDECNVALPVPRRKEGCHEACADMLSAGL